jgi:DNA primase
VVFLPDGDDPDSFSQKHTLEEIQDYIRDNEQDGIAFKTNLLLEEAGDDPLKKANLINEIADTVADIPDAIKRQVYVDTVARQFSIESDIIQDRVRKTREKQALDERVARDREQHRQQRAEVEEPAAQEITVRRLLEEDKILAPAERELLGFILRYGRSPLQFESDSEFYDPEGSQTVADFIDAALSSDDIRFGNKAYEATYNAYFGLYDQGLEQDAIVMALLNGEDRTVANVAADLSSEKYELTVHNFSDALTTTDSWLVTYVPKAILVYHDKRIEAQQAEIARKLKAGVSTEEALQLMNRLNRLNEIKKTINIKLGRLKK